MNLQYYKADTLPEALSCLRQNGTTTTVLAGATNVMVDMRRQEIGDGLLLDIGALTALHGIGISDGIIRVGALTTVAELEASPLLRQQAAALAMAAAVFADPLIRKRATLGGNLVNASPAADLAPPLLALQATLVLQSDSATRRVPIEEFFCAPNKTVRAEHELLTAVEFAPCAHSSFVKLGLRNALAISVATAAAALSVAENGALCACRVALGALAATPRRAPALEQLVMARCAAPADIARLQSAELAAAVAESIAPISDIRASAEYRRQIAPVVAKRALSSAACGERGLRHGA